MKTISKDLREHLSKIGRLGGKATSKEKALAAAQNGKKGGRPKKVIAVGA
jgi:general stress protein YciG